MVDIIPGLTVCVKGIGGKPLPMHVISRTDTATIVFVIVPEDSRVSISVATDPNFFTTDPHILLLSGYVAVFPDMGWLGDLRPGLLEAGNGEYTFTVGMKKGGSSQIFVPWMESKGARLTIDQAPIAVSTHRISSEVATLLRSTDPTPELMKEIKEEWKTLHAVGFFFGTEEVFESLVPDQPRDGEHD